MIFSSYEASLQWQDDFDQLGYLAFEVRCAGEVTGAWVLLRVLSKGIVHIHITRLKHLWVKLLKLLFINNHAVNGSQHSLTNRFMYIVYNISLMFFKCIFFWGGGLLVLYFLLIFFKCFGHFLDFFLFVLLFVQLQCKSYTT